MYKYYGQRGIIGKEQTKLTQHFGQFKRTVHYLARQVTPDVGARSLTFSENGNSWFPRVSFPFNELIQFLLQTLLIRKNSAVANVFIFRTKNLASLKISTNSYVMFCVCASTNLPFFEHSALLHWFLHPKPHITPLMNEVCKLFLFAKWVYWGSPIMLTTAPWLK